MLSSRLPPANSARCSFVLPRARSPRSKTPLFAHTEAKNADTGGVGSSGDGSVTYELFLKEASEARKFFGTGDGGLGEVSKVEARIAALEKALGGDGSGVGGTRFGDRGQVGNSEGS